MRFDRLIPPSTFKNYAAEIQRVIDSCIQKKRSLHVLVEPEKKKRSTGDYSQNHHLNGHIQQIAMYYDQPFEDVKRYMKQQAVTRGYPILMRAGKPVTDMWGNVDGISEADATSKECAILIDFVHWFADDNGIVLEEGNERFSY